MPLNKNLTLPFCRHVGEVQSNPHWFMTSPLRSAEAALHLVNEEQAPLLKGLKEGQRRGI